MGLGFAGLGLLPLPEVTAIGYAAPLLTVIFAAMFLGEAVRAFRITTVGLGLAGVLIILSPRFSALGTGGIGATETLGAMLVLVGAVFSALAQVFVRKLVMEERTTAIVFYFSVTSACLSLVTLPFGWAWPSPSAAAMLVAAGLLGGVGQVFLTSSYRYADASVVAPFEYASMILALGVGYFAFDEVPTLRVLEGAAVVVAAGIAIIWRERQLGLQRDKQRKSMTPQG
jgi:drug/metabolite transporter (DMT)-like permease